MKKQKKYTKKTTKVTKGLLAYHIAASLVTVASHPHTGRAIHPRHTSHGFLLVALILTGVLLFSNLGALRAYGVASTGSRTITVNIAGAPPTVGAQITFPRTQTRTSSSQIQVAGTCEASTLVATYRNGTFAGSSMCTTGGDFATIVPLTAGTNLLQSQNYDGLNQPGPVTPQVQIVYEQPVAHSTSASSDADTPVTATTAADVAADTTTPIAAAATQPSINPCYDTSGAVAHMGADPVITVNCVIRNIFAGDTLTVPVRVTGGTTPYALSIDWGDHLTDLKTILDTEYHNFEHVYKTTGIHNVALKTTDSSGAASFLQTVVQVNGSSNAPAGVASTFGTITAGLGSIWTEAPVPLYWAAVALVVGFWVGDIFQRIYLKGKYAPKRSNALRRRRHA